MPPILPPADTMPDPDATVTPAPPIPVRWRIPTDPPPV